MQSHYRRNHTIKLGTNILNLRKSRNTTQEELAAQLGVTATAVSKWEKGYTLPDVLMLCAIADYFDVTTDELLGRTIPTKQAIVISEDEALGQKISALAARYGIRCPACFRDYRAGLDYEHQNSQQIQYMFTALNHPLEEAETPDANGVIHVDVHKTGGSDEEILNGIELYLKNEDAFKSIAGTGSALKK